MYVPLPLPTRQSIDARQQWDQQRSSFWRRLDAVILARVHKFLNDPIRTKRWDAIAIHDPADCTCIVVGDTLPVPD